MGYGFDELHLVGIFAGQYDFDDGQRYMRMKFKDCDSLQIAI